MEKTAGKKLPMTEEERKLLAEKLDKELDDYINSLEKKPYSDGWPEDRWEEEMEKHPFFMTKSPEAGEELPPLLEGIQQLKYDENENTPEELAETYKEDGNFNFKCKKYRVAVISYTEGLKQNCNDRDLNAQLYNNRAAAHFFLKNYRSSLKDCQAALNLKTPYMKAQTRAAQCCLLLCLYDDCINMCDDMLLFKTDKDVLNLRAKAVSCKKIQERNLRKCLVSEQKEDIKFKTLLDAIQTRGIKLHKEDDQSSFTLSDLEPQCPQIVCNQVHLVEDRLVWPVLFLYPEYQLTDFIQEFHEDSIFEDHLKSMFQDKPEWDIENKYQPDNLRIYFENNSTSRMCNVPVHHTLSQTLSDARITVKCGTPTFIIVVAGSEVEQKYVSC